MKSPKSDFKIINFIPSIIGLGSLKNSKIVTKIFSFIINCLICIIFFRQFTVKPPSGPPRQMVFLLVSYVARFDQSTTKAAVFLGYIFMFIGRRHIAHIGNQLRTFDLKFKFIFVREINQKRMIFETLAYFSLTVINVVTFSSGHSLRNLINASGMILNMAILSVLFNFLLLLVMNIEVRAKNLLAVTREGKNLQEIQILVDGIRKIYHDIVKKYSTLFTLLISEFYRYFLNFLIFNFLKT
jgi:hypothetical protein